MADNSVDKGSRHIERNAGHIGCACNQPDEPATQRSSCGRQAEGFCMPVPDIPVRQPLHARPQQGVLLLLLPALPVLAVLTRLRVLLSALIRHGTHQTLQQNGGLRASVQNAPMEQTPECDSGSVHGHGTSIQSFAWHQGCGTLNVCAHDIRTGSLDSVGQAPW